MSIRIYKITGILFLILSFLCFGLYLGGQFERKDHAAAEARSEYVQTIAVVNLDEGIIKEDTAVYYSNDFLIYPNSNFILTGLEDARQGIHQGRYGAYMMIPASFSRSIASINGFPQKSTLEYAVNPNLETGIKDEVESDIRQFHLNLNTNISFVYVSSILEEFHNTQDASVVVLKNDQNELERISGIDAEKLLQNLAFPQLEHVDYELENLDVAGAFDDSRNVLGQMGEGILSNLEEGQEEFENVRETDDLFVNATKDLFELLMAITPGETLSGVLVYEEGLNKLEETIDTFHTEMAQKRSVISTRLYDITSQYRTQGGEYLNVRIPQLQDEVNLQLNNRLNLMQQNVDEALAQIQQDNHAVIEEQLVLMQREREDEYEWIQNYINHRLKQIYIDLKEVYEEDANQQLYEIMMEIGYSATPSEATPSEATPSEAPPSEADPGESTPSEATPSEAYQIRLATASEAEIDIGQSGMVPGEILGRNFPLKNPVPGLADNHNPYTEIWIALQASSIIFPDNFVVLPLINVELYHALAIEIEALYYISNDAVKEVLQKQVIEEIEKENMVHKTEIETMMLRLRGYMDDYEKSLNDFDPYLYVHMEEISGTLNDINKNMGLIDQSVYEKTSQDRIFVGMVYDLIGQNSDTLQKNMEKTNEQTLGNILNTIKTIQTSRVYVNQENTYLLEDFTRKLSYTRLGSLGNTTAYDFIVNPVSMESKDSEKRAFFQFDSDLSKYLFAGITLALLMAGSTAVFFCIRFLIKSRQKFSSK